MAADRKKRMLPALGLLFAGLLVTVLLWYLVEKREAVSQPAQVTITESGFFHNDLLIEVKAPRGVSVYYTTDGSEPSMENGVLYESPILLFVTEEEVVYSYRFRTYFSDGSESSIYTRTYILGANVVQRYTTNVLSVVGDPDSLFGYENGIFVKGKVFDEWKTANPDAFYGGGVDANFQWRGPEYERPVHIECFDEKGTSLFEVDGGVRVHGALSRMKNQKSFRLYARKEYDEKNEFEYPLVAALKNADGTVYDRYKRLLVRNAGNDNGFGFIRSELCCDLAAEAGFPDVCLSEPVTVYMNGQYMGIYWMGNNFDAGYFEEKYGTHAGQFVVLEGTGGVKVEDEDPAVQTYVDEYNDMFRTYMEKDLTDDEVYQALCQVFDVENYLQYCAIQIYIGNVDWPGNNVKVYRYVSPTGEYIEGTVFDGRYRNLLYDLDFGFGLLLLGGGVDETHRTLEMDLQSELLLLDNLTKRQDCREYFVNYLCDLMNGPMSAENVKTKLSQKHVGRQQELHYMIEETDLMKDSLWNWEALDVSDSSVQDSYNSIVKFAENRRPTMLNDIIASFDYDAIHAYTLILKNQGMSGVQINTLLVDEPDFNGVYFGNVPVTLQPRLSVNETFSHWLVNDEVRREKTLTLTSEDIKEAVIQVEIVTEPVDDALLEIHAVKARGTNDYVELINYSDCTISTQGYHLTDSDDAYRYPLPNVVLHPGETIRIYGKDATEAGALGSWGMNFNLRQGETLRLHRGEELVDSLVVPQLTSQGVYMKNHITGTYLEEIVE